MRTARSRLRPRIVPWDGPAYAKPLMDYARELASGSGKDKDWPLNRKERYVVLELALRQTYGLSFMDDAMVDDILASLRADHQNCAYARTLLEKRDDEHPRVKVETVLGGFLHDTCYLIARHGLAEPLSA